MTQEERESLAQLASLDEKDLDDKTLQDIEAVLGYVSIVKDVIARPGDSVFSDNLMPHEKSNCMHTKNEMREDIVTTDRGAYTEKLLAQAQQRNNNWIKVPPYVFLSKK